MRPVAEARVAPLTASEATVRSTSPVVSPYPLATAKDTPTRGAPNDVTGVT